MANELKSDGQDDLPIRRHLIDTAVGFLLNPNVKQRPDDAKITFLKKKGLTDSEIAVAFNRIKYEEATDAVSNKDNQIVNAYPLSPYQSPSSFWFYVRSYSSTFASFAIAVYLLHRFYKAYIEPFLFGSKSEKSELSALKQQLIELNNSVSQLSSTVASLELSLNNQLYRGDRSSLYDVESVPRSVRDILEEISNVKCLLLNRFSFPAPPPIAGATIENKTQNEDPKTPSKAVTIPKWQLRDSEHGKSKIDSKEVIENEDKEKSSELTPLENSLSSVRDQIQDQEDRLTIAEGKTQDEGFKTASINNVESLENKNGNSKAYLENKLCAKDKIQDDDSKMTVGNRVRNVIEEILNKDSGVGEDADMSDWVSTYQSDGPNGIDYESTTKSE
ncbi:peroxisomal membrane protein PEX14-like [Argiope bruennichi]|uniref:Peroxisomal membrane protein PEX14 n=1 Tax=Argiope bruennichi TaxID=94029 RepID=A0A8T0G004_ARGBR|nr:peroxisomal membrane protein PEX14-like [Argiope bruennichi]XP_055948654.1 peroxisomal membrane protein PEX14-like [Argiope bruennichi]XP_055948656.1 peroxisomal membrane protein PEX14-like [Argiope bruennichi]KAF8795768.1 Peroxisomal membrane protein PEX14 like protein [Argiope bruennichi]